MKKISLVMILGLSLILVGCGNQETNSEELKEQLNEQRNEEQQNVSKSESDFEMSECMKWCEMMRNKEWTEEKMFGDCKSLCTAWKAIEEWDASECENSEWIMRDSCYSSIAYETVNVSLCEKMSDSLMQFGCYAAIAEKTKSIDICKKIKEPMWKTSCEETVKAAE